MNLPFASNVYFGALVGFIATIIVSLLLNRFGDTMFRKGVAMPFFFGSRRVHHRHVLFYALPTIYVALAGLFLAGYITIVWGLFWTGLISTFLIAVSCLVFDLAFDYVKGTGRWGFLHHEFIYLAVPAYALAADFLRLAV